MSNLSEKNIKRLNSKKGVMNLLFNEEININRSIRYVKYEERLGELQEELIKLQHWAVTNNEKIVIVFEGRDAAGKGGAIRRITEFLNPRQYRVVALPQPDEVERTQWYFQRYINQFPKAGEIVFFDRSWYNRAIVEPVNGFCTKEEYKVFMGQVNDMEKMMMESGIRLIKFYFSITKDEQEKRFEDIIENPLKKWKYSSVDQKAIELWDEYTKYKKKMFKKTDTKKSPWVIINANRKTEARIEAIEYILNHIPYMVKNEGVIDHKDVENLE